MSVLAPPKKWYRRRRVGAISSVAAPFNGHATLGTGLVSYWKMEETSGVRVDSYGSNTLTDVNTVTSDVGKNNTGALFTAANSEELTVANNSSFDFSATGFTLNFWVKLTSGSIEMGKDDGATERQFLYQGSTFYVFQDDSTFSQVAAGVADTNWHMRTCWFDLADKKSSSALDAGVAGQGAALTGCQYQASTFRIGRSGAGVFINGLIDEFGLWARALSSQERTDLYNSGSGLFF